MNIPEPDLLIEPIIITESAASAVRELMIQRNLPEYPLRVYVSGGGCLGMQHGLAFEGHVRPEDTAFKSNGVKVVVDEISIEYLRGATLDYVESEGDSGFKISNPNILPSCSTCGADAGGGCCG